MTAKTPLYKQTVETLREDLVKGLYPAGTLLPSELELCERLRVSRHTLREAMRELKSAGLIESRRGAGTVVVHPDAFAHTYIHEAGSLAELNQYSVANWDIRQSRMVALDDALAQKLGDEKHREWLYIEAFRYIEDARHPVSWTELYLHPDYASLARMIGKQSRPIYELIQDIFGVHITDVNQTMRAVMADPTIARPLNRNRNDMVVSVERSYLANSGRMVEWSRNLYPADQFQFSIKLKRADISG